jgi:tetratricopeptide (TPR) repeat protein
MSASDEAARPKASPNVHRRSIVIRREEHVGEPIGLAFLMSADANADALMERIGKYLGGKLRIKRVDMSHEEMVVEAEARGWPEEGARMAAAARDLHGKGARRSALTMYRDALDIDPCNADAMLGIGLALMETEKFAEAAAMLKRAREFGAEGIDLLLALGRCAARLGRHEAAAAYYEMALKIEPRNPAARIAMHEFKSAGTAKPQSKR